MKKTKTLNIIALACAVFILGILVGAHLQANKQGYSGPAGAQPVVGDDGKVTSTGVGQGIDGDVVVQVVADANKIYSVEVLEQNETVGIGSVAVEQLPGKIVEANSILVDGISGATVTSTAIKTAIREALIKGGLDPSVFEVEVSAAAPGERTAKTLECDVLVVGAGGAGLTAAVRANQQGADVLIIEKMPMVGGNSNRAEGGMNAAGTKLEEELGLLDDSLVDGDNELRSTVENYIADTYRLGHDLANMDLVTTLAQNSSEAIEWLGSIGAPFTDVEPTGGCKGRKYLHQPEGGVPVGEYLVQKLSGAIADQGIEVMLNTKATEILVEDGVVVGVKAEDASHDYTIKAKSVVLATGGFGANFELMSSYDPSLANAVTTNHAGATGDGIKMAQAIGADTVDMEQIQLHPTVIQENGLLVSESLRSKGAIIVNTEGKRFVNDLAARDVVSQAELKQPNGYCYIVFDQNLVDNLSLAKKFIDRGFAIKGATYEELAKNLELNGDAAVQNFVQTMEKWNVDVANGEDTEFGRESMQYSLDTAPFYAIKIAPGIHHTMGGIKIDTEAQVIDTEGNVIPGLYAAGETTGGIHGGNRVGGNAVCDFVVFGRIAGAGAAQYAIVNKPVAVRDVEHTGKATAKQVETMSGVSVIHAADWAEQYPEIYASWLKNSENDEIEDYLQTYPQLITLYEPYGFSKSYGSARGHYYDVNDILETGRPHKYAQCWTCKTPDFTNLVNETGPEVYLYDFNEVGEQVTEAISCYSCHANTPGEITVTHTYVVNALGDDWDKVPAADLACGQCHVEYYFYPGTGVTSLPRSDLESMSPDAILDYYNNVLVDENGQGFADYTNPRTGVRQIKVQHPEFETFLGKGTVHGEGGSAAQTYTCADCHMGTVRAEDGSTYPNHYLTSPLENKALIEAECSACHADLVTEVKAVMKEVDDRTTAISDELVELTETLAKAVESGEYTEEELNAIRSLARDAQFYWDFVFVENSEGAHNPSLTKDCLDKAESLTRQALGMFKAA